MLTFIQLPSLYLEVVDFWLKYVKCRKISYVRLGIITTIFFNIVTKIDVYNTEHQQYKMLIKQSGGETLLSISASSAKESGLLNDLVPEDPIPQ